MSDVDDLMRDRKRAAGILRELQDIDQVEQGFVLATATAMWLRTFDPKDETKRQELYLKLLEQHVAATISLALNRRPK